MSEGQIRVYDGKGGFKTVPAGTKVELRDEKATQMREDAVRKEFFERAAAFSHYINKVYLSYARDHGLSPKEIAAGMYIESCSIRHFFPKESGGTPAYDELTKECWNWFKEELQKP
jgi:hypothetical protein